MEELVLVATLVLAVALTVRAARASQRRGAPGAVAQLAVGLLCGTCGAIIAAVPYADVVPDPWELPLFVVLVVGLVAAAALAATRRLRVRSGYPARSRTVDVARRG